MNKQPKPFIVYPGGKYKLSKHFIDLFPAKFNRYFEPFLGAGGVLLRLQPKKCDRCWQPKTSN